jgi:predicted transcriptional regulator
MIESVAAVVAAYVKKNAINADQLPVLIQEVSQSFAGLGQPIAEPADAGPLTPAVSIRRSIGAEAMICLDCGKTAKMLKRHIASAHGMTPDQYRARWHLPRDYPMVASGYSARRSELAKASGLGVGPRGRRSTK